VTLCDDRTVASEDIRYPRGHFRRGVERDVLWQKFSDCAAASVSRDRARSLFDALQSLPRLKSLSELRPPLAPAAE
jgi:2-methylcitrate dehydratase PrpD